MIIKFKSSSNLKSKILKAFDKWLCKESNHKMILKNLKDQSSKGDQFKMHSLNVIYTQTQSNSIEIINGLLYPWKNVLNSWCHFNWIQFRFQITK